jgi:uncharacterized protein (TIGR02598 family)
MPQLQNRAAAGVRGFTLVETALALGVTVFALVGLMALLPAGLALHRTAIDTSVGAQIFQRIATDAEQTDFDTLLGKAETSQGQYFTLSTRYFDDQGNEVVPVTPGAPTAREAARIVFWARVRGSLPGPPEIDAQASDGFTSLPASPGHNRFGPRGTIFLDIQIAANPGSRSLAQSSTLLWDTTAKANSGVKIISHTAILTRTDYQVQTGS